jgi:hypothetical protein
MRPVRPFVFSAVLTCVVSVLPATTAQAGFNATFTGADPTAGLFTYTARGTSHSSLAGRMNWTTTDAGAPAGLLGQNGQTGNAFVTFCIEVTEHVTANTSYSLNVQGLATLPGSGPASPMNANKANDLAQLWARWAAEIAALDASDGPPLPTMTINGTSYTHNEVGSALQLAVWEIVYEKDYSADGSVAAYDPDPDADGYYYYSVSRQHGSGQGFKVTGGDSDSRGLANYLLSKVDFNGGAAANLVGFLVGNGNQDQVGLLDGTTNNLVHAPAPAAVVLAVTGLVPCLVFRRRIAGRTAAN